MTDIRLITICGQECRVRVSVADTAAPHAYEAYDDDRYDGAPDGYHVCGRGNTREAAIADLIEQTEEHDS